MPISDCPAAFNVWRKYVTAVMDRRKGGWGVAGRLWRCALLADYTGAGGVNVCCAALLDRQCRYVPAGAISAKHLCHQSNNSWSVIFSVSARYWHGAGGQNAVTKRTGSDCSSPFPVRIPIVRGHRQVRSEFALIWHCPLLQNSREL